MNNTIFGDHVPMVPQWPGPSYPVVQVQSMLYASLATSLFAAFLAMLGKQWLNRYSSIDMRGTAIERSQNRQKKLDGIVTWYFDHVMELLPLMLQSALLLLGCALSLYVWGINKTVTSVILGITLAGAICYIFIVIAGTASMSCPYQTPGAQFLRYLWNKVLSYSIFFTARQLVVWDPKTQPGSEQTSNQEATVLDFPCISWMLQTSLDRDTNQLTLKFLVSVIASPGLRTTLVADCFNIFVGCIGIPNGSHVVVLQGSEQLAETAAICLLGTLSHSLVMDPKSHILKDVRQQFNRCFLPTVSLQSIPFHRIISVVDKLFNEYNRPKGPNQKGVDHSAPESHLPAHILVRVAWLCQRLELEGQKRAPHWVLYSLFHRLLQDPNPPVSAIADCLLVIGINLGCNVSESDIRGSYKRYVMLA